MCDQTELKYNDGDIVWVKFHNFWWPGEVHGEAKLPPDLLKSFRKMPVAVVKFFQENAYEYVKSINDIYSYNCIRKHEFIKKGLGNELRHFLFCWNLLRKYIYGKFCYLNRFTSCEEAKYGKIPSRCSHC